MARTIAIANQKGALEKQPRRLISPLRWPSIRKPFSFSILILSQTQQVGWGLYLRSLPKSLSCLLRGEPVKDIISQTTIPGLSIAPANSELAGAEVELVNLPDREQIFKSCLQSVLEHLTEIYVIVDCPPALGLLTINALVAVGSVLIPVQCEYYAMEGRGLIST